jgi:hypothetical protein
MMGEGCAMTFMPVFWFRPGAREEDDNLNIKEGRSFQKPEEPGRYPHQQLLTELAIRSLFN